MSKEMKQMQKIVETKDYLFRTWIKGTEIIKTEKGDISVIDLLTDFRSHLLQDIDHNMQAYADEQNKELKQENKEYFDNTVYNLQEIASLKEQNQKLVEALRLIRDYEGDKREAFSSKYLECKKIAIQILNKEIER